MYVANLLHIFMNIINDEVLFQNSCTDISTYKQGKCSLFTTPTIKL